MAAYYNEIDPHNAEWLRNLIDAGLIPAGHVDQRSIVDVRPGDVSGYNQCHWFAGVGGWPFALRLAGWPDNRAVWTGSEPCQPFSEAGRGLGFADPRDLWEPWLNLIGERRPPSIFGEQVASPAGVEWADRAAGDLEAAGYAFGTAVLSPTLIGSPQKRARFYFVAHAIGADAAGRTEDRRWSEVTRPLERTWSIAGWNGGFSSYGRLADGLSGRVAKRIAGGFGNAIVPQLAAAFIECTALTGDL